MHRIAEAVRMRSVRTTVAPWAAIRSMIAQSARSGTKTSRGWSTAAATTRRRRRRCRSWRWRAVRVAFPSFQAEGGHGGVLWEPLTAGLVLPLLRCSSPIASASADWGPNGVEVKLAVDRRLRHRVARSCRAPLIGQALPSRRRRRRRVGRRGRRGRVTSVVVAGARPGVELADLLVPFTDEVAHAVQKDCSPRAVKSSNDVPCCSTQVK